MKNREAAAYGNGLGAPAKKPKAALLRRQRRQQQPAAAAAGAAAAAAAAPEPTTRAAAAAPALRKPLTDLEKLAQQCKMCGAFSCSAEAKRAKLGEGVFVRGATGLIPPLTVPPPKAQPFSVAGRGGGLVGANGDRPAERRTAKGLSTEPSPQTLRDPLCRGSSAFFRGLCRGGSTATLTRACGHVNSEHLPKTRCPRPRAAGRLAHGDAHQAPVRPPRLCRAFTS